MLRVLHVPGDTDYHQSLYRAAPFWDEILGEAALRFDWRSAARTHLALFARLRGIDEHHP